jgi:L-seryl-tRNA(Ser) seleniumtransferase
VTFSGDKLLGGPQAGVIVGRQALIARLRKHPLTRAIRPDKLTLAALGATLVHYVRGEAEQQVPVWRMLTTPPAELERRASHLAEQLNGQVVPTRSAVGGGSLPGQTQPSFAVALPGNADQLATALRHASPPIVARIENDQVLLDLRTVLPEQDELLTQALQHTVPPLST